MILWSKWIIRKSLRNWRRSLLLWFWWWWRESSQYWNSVSHFEFFLLFLLFRKQVIILIKSNKRKTYPLEICAQLNWQWLHYQRIRMFLHLTIFYFNPLHHKHRKLLIIYITWMFLLLVSLVHCNHTISYLSNAITQQNKQACGMRGFPPSNSLTFWIKIYYFF